jgi:chitin disaccharide deacetylase
LIEALRIPAVAGVIKGLIISADDYGYRPSYDAGILEVARAGAIDAVSVMVRRGPVNARDLLLSGIEVGLHLELDLAAAGTVADEVDRRAAQAALVTQLGEFEAAFGRPPAFVDSHHHAHAMPGLAGVVAEVAARGGLPVRSVDEPHRRLLRRLGVRTPDLLVGRMREAEPVMPPELEAVMLGGRPPAGVVEWMVHPGHPDPASGSAYDAGREQDLRLLIELLDAGTLRRLRTTHAGALGA